MRAEIVGDRQEGDINNDCVLKILIITEIIIEQKPCGLVAYLRLEGCTHTVPVPIILVISTMAWNTSTNNGSITEERLSCCIILTAMKGIYK